MNAYAPSSTNSLALANASPDVAPVTTATLPSACPCCASFAWQDALDDQRAQPGVWLGFDRTLPRVHDAPATVLASSGADLAGVHAADAGCEDVADPACAGVVGPSERHAEVRPVLAHCRAEVQTGVGHRGNRVTARERSPAVGVRRRSALQHITSEHHVRRGAPRR